MNGRDRLLMALDGGEPDRVPRALSFYRVDLKTPGAGRPVPGGRGGDGREFRPVSPCRRRKRRWSGWPSRMRPTRGWAAPAQVAHLCPLGLSPRNARLHQPTGRRRGRWTTCAAFRFPDTSAPYLAKGLARQVQALHARGMAAGGGLPHLGGELFEAAWRLRGLENFLLDLVERPDWADYLLDRLADLARRNAEALARAGVDLLALDDDVGMPGTMIIGPAMWRRFLKPRMAGIIQAARAIQPDLRVLYHSDGYFEPIVGDLIEIGVNAINPLEPEHMDAAHIRRRFGPRLALWGTVGRQTTFSFATPEEIRREVRERIETLGRAGLILCPAYDIDEPDIPWANIAAFVEGGQVEPAIRAEDVPGLELFGDGHQAVGLEDDDVALAGVDQALLLELAHGADGRFEDGAGHVGDLLAAEGDGDAHCPAGSALAGGGGQAEQHAGHAALDLFHGQAADRLVGVLQAAAQLLKQRPGQVGVGAHQVDILGAAQADRHRRLDGLG